MGIVSQNPQKKTYTESHLWIIDKPKQTFEILSTRTWVHNLKSLRARTHAYTHKQTTNKSKSSHILCIHLWSSLIPSFPINLAFYTMNIVGKFSLCQTTYSTWMSLFMSYRTQTYIEARNNVLNQKNIFKSSLHKLFEIQFKSHCSCQDVVT